MNLLRPTGTEWKCGDTFFHDRDGGEHLPIVLSDPAKDPSRVVFVNFSSQTYHEQTCVIEIGEHPFVTKKTRIPYRFAYILPLAYLEDDAAIGKIRRDVPLSPELLRRALAGAARSLFMPIEAWAIIEDQGLVDPF
jgi:hypothetical protein